MREIVHVFQRCENFYANDLSRNERELERSQRMRLGERLPPPAVLDVTVRAADSAKDVLIATQHESNPVVPKVPESFSETPPQNTRSGEIPNVAARIESQDAESSTNLNPSALASSVDHNWDSPPEPLWQNAPRKPLWSK